MFRPCEAGRQAGAGLAQSGVHGEAERVIGQQGNVLGAGRAEEIDDCGEIPTLVSNSGDKWNSLELMPLG